MAAVETHSHQLSVTRPGIRAKTRSDVIAILASTANGCLQELGYSPGLLERLKYLQDEAEKARTQIEMLHSDNKKLRAISEELQAKCLTYQNENVKLYEDNSRLVGERDELRKEVDSLSGQLAVHQQARGNTVSEILAQYSMLQAQYASAVNQLRTKPASNTVNTAVAAHSQPHLVANEITIVRAPTMVPSQSQIPYRRGSAPQPQAQTHSHPPPASHLPPSQHPGPSSVSSHPHPPNQAQTHVSPQRQRSMGPAPGISTLSLTQAQSQAFAQSLIQRPFDPLQHPHTAQPSLMSPLATTPTSASTPTSAHAQGLPIGYGMYSTTPPLYRSSNATVNAIASGSRSVSASGSRRGSGSGNGSGPVSSLSAATSAAVRAAIDHANAAANPALSGRSVDRGTPTPMQMPMLPQGPPMGQMRTPPMSALPLNLQNFPQPHPPHGAHSGPPSRTGSASSSSRTPVRRPSEQAVFVPPPDVREEPVLAPAPKPAPAPPVTPPSNPTPAPDLEPEMVQDALSFPAPKRSHSPPEAHEAVTPPLDASAPAVTVVVPDQAQPNQDPNSQSPSLPLKRASPTADEEDEARKRARVEEPVVKTETEAEVKMEVDDSLGGAGQGGGAAGEEDEEEEDGFIEVGPDGLRTVRDCVDAVFDADEGYVCLFCKARYDADALKGVESAAPQGMGGASMEELAQHCEVEHAFAWNLLRTNVNPRSSESQ